MISPLNRTHRAWIVVAWLCVLWCAGAVRAQAPRVDQALRWRMIGPFRGGRTRALCGVASEPNVFYVGAVDGGVWKSNDYGRTWKPIFDAEDTQSIGAIAVAPSNPNIVYVASGEGLARPDLSIGDGIYKSTDAGKTWTHLGLRDAEQIPALAVDPANPARVYAAVLGHPYGPSEQRGIFRSNDGGKTWQKVLYVDANTGGDDVEIDPSNPDTVYATLWAVRQGPWEYNNEYQGAEGGIFVSNDAGDTWRKLSKGLPAGLVQAYIAIAPSDSTRLYATVATSHTGAYGSGAGLGIYRSDDSGATWHRATSDGRPAAKIGGGDLPVPKVDPKNPDVVYSTSIVTWRSTDGGKTWTGIRGAPGGDDYQNIWINPRNPKIILLVSDQGALVTVNGGETWSTWYNQPTAQLYHVEVSPVFPYRVCGGQQESGSVCIASRGNDGEITEREWHPVGAIEYGYVAPDPLHPGTIFGAGTNEVSKYFEATGQVQDVTPIPLRSPKYRVDRTQPLIFSPVDPHVLYYAANFVYKTSNGGESWQQISPDLARQHDGIPASLGDMAATDPNAAKQRGVVYALAPSFRSINTLWAGTDDGYVWITRDGGKRWTNITPPGLTPWSKVTQIAASHFDDETAYASVSRFRIDDLRPYIFRTHDGGKTWQAIANGLPANAPVDTVREDPARKGLLFAGTEDGAWVSFDDGDHWQSLQLNLPHTSVRDLWIYQHDLIAATHGRSFWILDDITPMEQSGGRFHTPLSTSQRNASGAWLFKPETAYRIRRDTNTDTPIPPDEPAGQNPPDGAIIDYLLRDDSSAPVTLEILDARGKLVRRYSSTDKPSVTQAELEKQSIPLYWIRMPRILPATAGAHRWLWDLHYAAPKVARYEYPISAVPHNTPRVPMGPRALPGRYTVRLTVNGHAYSQPLLVKMDPRVHTTAQDLERQFEAETRLASMMDREYEVASEVRSVRDQLQKLSGRATGPLKDSIGALENKIADFSGQPAGMVFIGAPATSAVTLGHVSGETRTLYEEIDGADCAPTLAQTQALAAVERDFSALTANWDQLKRTDLAALNRRLPPQTLPVIRIGH